MNIEFLKLNELFDELKFNKTQFFHQHTQNLENKKHFISLIISEISYFKYDFLQAMEYDEYALHFDNECYASNILTEHFYAYTFASIHLQKIDRAKDFYKFFLCEKEKLNLPTHKLNFYRFQINQHISKLDGIDNLNSKKNVYYSR